MSPEDSRRKELVRAARDVIFGGEKVIYMSKVVLLAKCCERGAAARHETGRRLGAGRRGGGTMLSPLYCVVKLRYALRASSIESSESQGLETISWSSVGSLIEGCRKGAIANHDHDMDRSKGWCRSAGLAGHDSPFQNCWGSETSGSISHRARSGSSGVVSQGTHPVLLCRGEREVGDAECVWCLEAGEVVSSGVHFTGHPTKIQFL